MIVRVIIKPKYFFALLLLCAFSCAAASCKTLISSIEKEFGIPHRLLEAISIVESRARPWAVNARGRSYSFRNHDAATTFVQKQHKRGAKALYVGCMQICVRSHKKKFDSIKDILDPEKNVRYAAKLLKKFYTRYRSWEKAVMLYNASARRVAYKNKVMRVWNKNKQKV